MQIEINFNQQIQQSSISYEQAQDLLKLNEMTKSYEKLRDTAQYLYGNKRGAWGRMTQADEKRSMKLDIVRASVKYFQKKYDEKYNN